MRMNLAIARVTPSWKLVIGVLNRIHRANKTFFLSLSSFENNEKEGGKSCSATGIVNPKVNKQEREVQ